MVVGGGDGGGGGIKPFQPLARAAFKLCGLNSQHFEFQMDMRRLGRELCLSLLHTCTHTHPLWAGGGSGGNEGGWLPREMKGCLSQKRETNKLLSSSQCGRSRCLSRSTGGALEPAHLHLVSGKAGV